MSVMSPTIRMVCCTLRASLTRLFTDLRGYNTLRNGIFMIGLSLGVIVGMMLDSAFTYDSDWFFLLVPAITIMFGGVAFIIYFFLSRSLMEKERLEDEKKMRLEE